MRITKSGTKSATRNVANTGSAATKPARTACHPAEPGDGLLPEMFSQTARLAADNANRTELPMVPIRHDALFPLEVVVTGQPIVAGGRSHATAVVQINLKASNLMRVLRA